MKVLGVGGGIGASRVWSALQPVCEVGDLTVVVNNGDDMWMHGLRICPDLDTVTYALAGRQDLERGWGVKGETWRNSQAFQELGGESWFQLGDVDLAMHLLRTGELARGTPLSEITRRVSEALGVPSRILPATDDPVTTVVHTREYGRIHYEEYLVRHGAAPRVKDSEVHGLLSARPAPGVLEGIAEADLIIIGPSNPVASVDPILGIEGVRASIRGAQAPVVVMSPIVSAVRIQAEGESRRACSRAALLEARGVPADPVGVASMYLDLASLFVIDRTDVALAPQIEELGVDVAAVPTLLHQGNSADELLDTLLGAANQEATP